MKRMNHLEAMERQMEILKSIDIDKVILTMTEKDRKL